MYIDLHTHTTCSDGRKTCAELLQLANQCSLDLFSISDHNSVGAYSQLPQCRHLFGGRMLSAVELSTSFEGQNIEVLGYGIDTAKMQEYITKNYPPADRLWIEELNLLIKTLLSKGARLSDEYLEAAERGDPEIKDAFGGARGYLLGQLKKYPENAKIFGGAAEFEKIDRHIFARQWISNPKSPIYTDRTQFCPSLRNTVDAIHDCGGLVFLAHAFVYTPEIILNLDRLSSHLDGLECYYGTFTKEQIRFLSDYCDKNRLYKSGGSDFHGLDMRPKNLLGKADGDKIDISVVRPWLDKVRKI